MRYKWKCLECVLREWCVFRGVAGIRLCLSKSGNWVTNLTAQLSTRRLWACVRVCVCVSISVYIYVCGFSYRTCLTHDTCFNETDLFSNVDTYFFLPYSLMFSIYTSRESRQKPSWRWGSSLVFLSYTLFHFAIVSMLWEYSSPAHIITVCEYNIIISDQTLNEY